MSGVLSAFFKDFSVALAKHRERLENPNLLK